MHCNLPRYLLSTLLPEGRMEKVKESAEEIERGGPGVGVIAPGASAPGVSGGLGNGGQPGPHCLGG